MEASQAKQLPSGPEWTYEPKWDGFRCIVFRSGDLVVLQSKSGQPLGRYFPELADALEKIKARRFVLDGEIVIEKSGRLSFDDLLLRIHPAASRVQKLARITPCTYQAFDLLVDPDGNGVWQKPLWERQQLLARFVRQQFNNKRLRISPHSNDRSQAEQWMKNIAVIGFDGVMAKRLDLPYLSGQRTGMEKIKNLRTADCVVGGFRGSHKKKGVGSLLLGLYNRTGQLDHIGFTSSFKAEDRNKLAQKPKPYLGGQGFTGKAPGGPSRWSTKQSSEWKPLTPRLVCEVQYDHFSGGRFRHGTKFLRWRPDKDPSQCTMEQVTVGMQSAA